MRSAVIDIGSNSIKLLVAEGVRADPVFETIRETRLSPNVKSARERISGEAFSAGLESVRELSEIAEAYAPRQKAVVGTSLFRTAENAPDFAAEIFRITGTPMRILSGEEEAALIADGVRTDSRVRTPCAIFDLGGGSLEFIACPSRGNASVFACSLQLGAVRLSRMFFKDTQNPIPQEQISALRMHVKTAVEELLKAQLNPSAQVIFCGGAAGISARLLPELTHTAIEELLTRTATGTQAERVALGVPEKRADIFPAGLAVFAEICAVGKISSALYTKRNLRYGLCARLNAGIRG